MRFKKRAEEEIRLGIAPLIDIVFLLLIFFMVTSHFDVASGIRISLPKVAKRFLDQQENRVILLVDKSGQIYLEGKNLDMKTLYERLAHLVKERGLFQVILQADKEVQHGRVVQVMDTAKRAGAGSILIAARWKPEEAE